MRARSGFTIVETTVVLALSSALAAISLPRAWSFIDRVEVSGAVTEIESMFSLARHTAIARGEFVSVDMDAGRNTVSIRSGNETIRSREVGLAHGVTLSTNRATVSYSPIGVGYGAANLSLVVTRGRSADTVVVSRLGRVRH